MSNKMIGIGLITVGTIGFILKMIDSKKEYDEKQEELSKLKETLKETLSELIEKNYSMEREIETKRFNILNRKLNILLEREDNEK